MTAGLRTRGVVRARRRGFVLALVLAFFGAVWAETCLSVPGASELTVADLGRVVFQELSTDRAADAARFEGGVCIEVAGERATIRADRIDVFHLTTDPTVRALGAVVSADGWRFGAVSLEANAHTVRLRSASLEGDGFVAVARELVLDVPSATVTGSDLMAATAWARLDIHEARLNDETVVGHGVVLSTCDCPPSEARLRLESAGARMPLRGGVVEVFDGTLVLGAVRIPLGDRLEIDPAAAATFRPPFGLEFDERRGWLLTLLERDVSGGRFAADLALEGEASPRWRALLGAQEERTRLSVVLASTGVDVRTSAALPLRGAWSIRLAQRIAGGEAFGVQDAALALRHGPDQALTATPPGSVSTRFEVGTALSAERAAGAEVASPRTWTNARVDVASTAGALGVLRVRFEGGVTGALVTSDGQRWWGATPRWDARFGHVAVSLSHVYRGVAGSTPFSTELDRVEPRQLSTLALRVHDVAAWTANAEVRFDWRPDDRRPGHLRGLERARVAASALLADPARGAGPALSARVTLELAGIIDPRPERDAFARVGVDATWPDANPEISLDATLGLAPNAVSLRHITLGVGAPLRFEAQGLTLRPYLAYDVWPTLQGDGWPALRGHGLALTWETAYGMVDAAYRNAVDGTTTSSVSVRLPLRTPSLDDLR